MSFLDLFNTKSVIIMFSLIAVEMVVQGVAEEKYLLLATYHGKHNYYVCADNWNQQMSYDMCQYLTGRFTSINISKCIKKLFDN